MEIQFHKYQGTGNDFVILDNRDERYNNLTVKQISFLCDRRFGIGADGLMLLNKADGYDFEMIYFNADGRESTMCGNGGRCLVKFAHEQGIKKSQYSFLAIDGPHEAEIDTEDGAVSLRMKDVNKVKEYQGDYLLDTGSPHYVRMVNDVMNYDVFREGYDIRNSTNFVKDGINVNFVETKGDYEIVVRTYERGVENETLSCGTGVTACALVAWHNERGFNNVTVHTRGGDLTVEYDRLGEQSYANIWLCGPAIKVFEGTLQL